MLSFDYMLLFSIADDQHHMASAKEIRNIIQVDVAAFPSGLVCWLIGDFLQQEVAKTRLPKLFIQFLAPATIAGAIGVSGASRETPLP